MIKAVVADDEWYNLEEISDLIENAQDFHVVKKYQNPLILLEEINVTDPQVLFLDIEMPEIDGLTLAERILALKPERIIVFITSFNQYAVQAFDLNAIDYIMKPINLARFHKMIEKVKHEVELRRQNSEKDLTISCFGQFEVLIGDTPVKWERSKAEEVFAFLVMNHNKYINKELIIDYIWPQYNPQKALQILQTSVCKIRNIFYNIGDKVVIDYSQNKYCLLLKDVKCDLLLVEEVFERHRQGEDISGMIDNIIAIGKNGFLAKQGYLWGLENEEKISKKLIDILKYMLDISDKKKDLQGQLKVLRYLAELVPYDEEVNYRLIKQMLEHGRNYEAKRHYEWLSDILKEEYDMEPGEKMKKEFRKLI